MAEKFLKLVKKTDIQVQDAQKVLNEMNPERPTPRHIIIKMQKLETETILKAAEDITALS